MIFKKGNMWKISGLPTKYSTREEAEQALAKINVQEAKLDKARKQKLIEEQEKALAIELERQKKLDQLRADSTLFEKMIVKNICDVCNLEPCECSTYTKKTELGKYEE